MAALRWLPMSFSCPHFDLNKDYCYRVKTGCIPGRPGCVLQHNSVFAVPVEERIQAQEGAERPARLPVKKKKRV